MQDIIQNNITVFSVILIILAVLGVIVLIAKRWKIAEPDEALIVTGVGRENGVSKMDVIIDGGKFIIPFMQKMNRLSLRSQEIQAQIPNAITRDKIPVVVDLVALIRVAGTQDSVRLAAQRYLGQEERIRTSSQEVLIGSIRAIVGEMTVTEILEDRKTFGEKVREVSEATFENQGLTIESLTIKEFDDENGYINDLGRPEIARNQRIANIQEAEEEQLSAAARADADIKIAQYRKKVQLEQSTIQAETEREQARASQSGPLAKAQAEREVITEQAEATRLRADLRAAELEVLVNKEADAARYKQLQEAEGDRDAQQAIAEGNKRQVELAAQADAISVKTQAEARAQATLALAEAEAQAEKVRVERAAEATASSVTYAAKSEAESVRLRAAADAESESVRATASAKATQEVGTAEAEVILAKGSADATAMEKKAEAYNKYGEAAITEMITGMLPQVFAANAEAFANIQNVSIFDGLEGFSRSVAGNGNQINELMKNQFGLDVPGLISGALGGKIAATPSRNTPVEVKNDVLDMLESAKQTAKNATKEPVEKAPLDKPVATKPVAKNATTK